MRGSLIIILFFMAGCLISYFGFRPAWLEGNFLPAALLYLLMFEVGLSIGSDSRLKTIIKSIKPKVLLLPLGTVCGTLFAAALCGLFISRWGIFDSLAIGSGFGYYSLSSILIAQLKTPIIGAEAANALAAAALIANLFREMLTLVATPLILKYFGPLAPIAAGGVTSMDATLPVITEFCGKDMVFIAIVHGILLDFSVPFFVSFFCSLGV